MREWSRSRAAGCGVSIHHVRQVAPDGIRATRLFEFDRDYKLHAIMTAGRSYQPGACWTLSTSSRRASRADRRGNIVSMKPPALRFGIQSGGKASEFKPDIFG